MSKILVAYFSVTGTTKKLAEGLAESIDADVFSIQPQKPYTDKDLNWKNPLSRTMKEYLSKSKPTIIGNVKNMEDYDTVLIGFPIWFLKQPNIILTFLNQYDFSGKTLSAFATSTNVGIDKAEKSLKNVCNKANWKPCILANEKSINDLEKWFINTVASD